MTQQEEQYRKELEAAGVEIPGSEAGKAEQETPAPEAPAAKEEAKETTKEESEEDTKGVAKEESKKEESAPLQDEPKQQRKRSIYDDYKEKKSELKTETERREQAERERDELKQKLDAIGKADTPAEKKEAADELEAFAKKIGAEPSAIREMRDLFLKDFKLPADEALLRDLEEFKAWKAENASTIEKVRFDEEFQASTPKLKELFPNASPEDLSAIKTELDKISHTKEWHDKSLAYIAFEHKDKLSALVTPKKRGMEGNDRKADTGHDSSEFDPGADFSKMTPKQREEWVKAYEQAGKTEGLTTSPDGKRKIIL